MGKKVAQRRQSPSRPPPPARAAAATSSRSNRGSSELPSRLRRTTAKARAAAAAAPSTTPDAAATASGFFGNSPTAAPTTCPGLLADTVAGLAASPTVLRAGDTTRLPMGMTHAVAADATLNSGGRRRPLSPGAAESAVARATMVEHSAAREMTRKADAAALGPRSSPNADDAAAAAAADAEPRHYGHTLFVASLEKSLGRLEVTHRGQAQALPDDDDGAARLNQALRLASLDAPPPHAATFSTAAPHGEDGEGVGGGGAGGEVFYRSSDGLRRVAREMTQIAASRQ